MKYIYSLAQATSFTWPGIDGRVYSQHTDFESASAARIRVTGRHGRCYDEVSDLIYLVLAGSGYFDIGDRRFPVNKDDVVIIPHLTEFDYDGDMELFLVHVPSFNAENNHKLADSGSGRAMSNG